MGVLNDCGKLEEMRKKSHRQINTEKQTYRLATVLGSGF